VPDIRPELFQHIGDSIHSDLRSPLLSRLAERALLRRIIKIGKSRARQIAPISEMLKVLPPESVRVMIRRVKIFST